MEAYAEVHCIVWNIGAVTTQIHLTAYFVDVAYTMHYANGYDQAHMEKLTQLQATGPGPCVNTGSDDNCDQGGDHDRSLCCDHEGVSQCSSTDPEVRDIDGTHVFTCTRQ